MTTEGVDYAWQKPTPATLAAAGKRFACRYLCGDPTNGKNLTAAEAKALTAAGVAVVSNWEWSSGDAKKGYAAGRAYAAEALKQATACGMPAGRPIYFSVDFDPTPGDWAAISEYFRGIRSVLGLAGTGIYGGYNTISHAVAGKWAGWFWQTFAWSNGRWHPSSHIQQYRNGVTLGGADLDLDRAMTNDYGQWTVGGAQEADMSFDDPDRKTLQAIDMRLREFLKLADSIPNDLSGQPFPLPAAVALKALRDRGAVDPHAVATEVLAVLSPAAIAAAIPTELARQVADELHARLAS